MHPHGRVVNGIVLRARGGVYDIETDAGVVQASLRGRLKREERLGEKVVAGDRVRIASEGPPDQITRTIEQVEERDTVLARRAPGKAPRAKVIVANVDQVLLVFAAAKPTPHLRMLDRFLVISEASGLPPTVIVNKVDLVSEETSRALFAPYERAGYPVLYTAAKQGIGLSSLRDTLCGRVSALTGPSGVGKSSLLNAIQPGLALRVASVSEQVNKGRHTTVTAQLIPLECGGYVADTPGLREVGLWGIDTDELHLHFPEFEPYLGKCRYANSCTHSHEPGCAVASAVAEGAIDAARYDSYRRMFAGDDNLD